MYFVMDRRDLFWINLYFTAFDRAKASKYTILIS